MKKLLIPFVIILSALAADPDLRITRVHSSMQPVVQATSTAAAISALGINPMQFSTADPPASAPALTNVSAVAFSTTGKQYLWNTTSQGWDFFDARGAQEDTGYPVNFTRRNTGNGVGNEWFAPWWVLDGEGAYATPPATNILTSSPQTFTSGLENWAATGGNSVAYDTGRLVITYVDDQWGAQLPLNTTGSTLTENLDGNQFYRARMEAYAAGGNADVGIYHDQGGSYSTIATAAATTAGALPTTNFVYEMHLRHHASGDSSKLTAMGMGAGESVSIDNVYFSKIAPYDCVAVRTNEFAGDVVVRAGIKRGVGYAGIIARANQLARPDSYLCVVAPQQYESANSGIMIYKVISGTWTKITMPSTTYVGWLSGTAPVVGLELAVTGTDYVVRVNGYPVYTNTVPVELQSNTYHGMLSSGGTSRVVSWTMQTPTEASSQESSLWWFGGSLSYATDAPPNHLISSIMAHQAARRFKPMVGAQNGYRAYNHILRQTIWESLGEPAPSFIFADMAANHSTNTYDKDLYDGFIRRLRKQYPNAAILSPAYAQWTYSGSFVTNTLFNSAARDYAASVSLEHALPLVRLDYKEFLEVAAGFYPVTTHYTAGDGTHPNTVGKLWRSGELRPFITDAMIRGVHNHPVLTATDEVYAGSSWWTNTATWTWAAADTTATWSGTWADEANVEWTYEYPTRRAARWSQNIGDTLTITGTWRILVLQYQVGNNNRATVAIDGGTPYNLTSTANTAYANSMGVTTLGAVDATSAAHTLVLTMTSAAEKFRILGWLTM